jgi:AcrR family transcriptional regulator
MTLQADGPGSATLVPEPHDVAARAERRDAAENRQRVLQTAQRLFSEHGVEAVSMHQIAMAAGVGQATLYRRYAHKGELCTDLMFEYANRFREEVAEYLAESRDGTPPLDQLTWVLSRAVQLVETKFSLLAAIGDACWGGRRIEKFQSPFYAWYHSTVAGLLTEAIARGDMRPVDTTFAADAIIAALSPDVYQFQREVRGLTRAQILDGVCRIFAEHAANPSTSAEART